jgi:hypothetical protein
MCYVPFCEEWFSSGQAASAGNLWESVQFSEFRGPAARSPIASAISRYAAEKDGRKAI